MAKIVYPRPGSTTGEINLIIPAPDCGMSVEEIARKDTPAGVPYKIVKDSALPENDLIYLDSWEVDFSKPDGYGIGSEAWFLEQEAKRK